MYRLLIVSLLSIVGCSSDKQTVVGITDGDTITVLNDKKVQTKIRLWGIDAPEKKQAFGDKAKSVLSSKIYMKKVDVDIKNRDRYGRTIANIYLNGRWINKEMVVEGMAWYYKQYAPKAKDLEEAEKLARSNKVGLWSDKHPIPPSEFRGKKK